MLTEVSSIALVSRVLELVEAIAVTIIRGEQKEFIDIGIKLSAVVEEFPMIASFVGERLQLLVSAPWFTICAQSSPIRRGLCHKLSRLSIDPLLHLHDDASLHSIHVASESPSIDPVLDEAGAAAAVNQAPGSNEPVGLSRRELEVVTFVAEGLTNKQIALKMGLSPNTVKRHMARILKRLGLSSRAALASWYVSSGRGSGVRRRA